ERHRARALCVGRASAVRLLAQPDLAAWRTGELALERGLEAAVADAVALLVGNAKLLEVVGGGLADLPDQQRRRGGAGDAPPGADLEREPGHRVDGRPDLLVARHRQGEHRQELAGRLRGP